MIIDLWGKKLWITNDTAYTFCIMGHLYCRFGSGAVLVGIKDKSQSILFWLIISTNVLKYIIFSDDRFPDYGKVELVFSATPEKIQGG